MIPQARTIWQAKDIFKEHDDAATVLCIVTSTGERKLAYSFDEAKKFFEENGITD